MVGCAGVYLAEHDAMVAAARGAGGGTQSERVITLQPTDSLRGSEGAAWAIAAILGMKLAADQGRPWVNLQVLGRFDLAGRLVARREIAELDNAWNETLGDAYVGCRRISATSAALETMGPALTAALEDCARLRELFTKAARPVGNG